MLLVIKMICKDSFNAFNHTYSNIFVNSLILHNIIIENSSFLFGTLDKSCNMYYLKFLSNELLMNGFNCKKYNYITYKRHCLKDPFYPNKLDTRGGNILRFRKLLYNNKYLDSILNIATKPKITRDTFG